MKRSVVHRVLAGKKFGVAPISVPLHVVGTNSNYIVTFAQFVGDDGPQVVIDVAGRRKRADNVTCSATSPITGRDFTFEGFFTPARDKVHVRPRRTFPHLPIPLQGVPA